MGSSFFEFNIATTGLFAARAGLEVTSNNISNSSTKGYSRQYVMQRATTPLDRYSGVGQVGTGTEVYGIGQHRDVYLDKKYWVQNSTFGEQLQKNSQLGAIEGIFGALAESGLTKNVNSFFDGVSNLKFDAGDLNYRSAVVNNASALAANIRNYAFELRRQQTDLNEEIYSLTNRISAIGTQIADINDQIYKFEISGQTANELRDQRTLLLDELSKYVNIETKEYSDGSNRELGKKFNVLINGQEFVSHTSSKKLTVERRQNPLHADDAPNLYEVVWENGTELNTDGLRGELKGLIDSRDGDSGGIGGEYKGIPYYVDKLNEFAVTMAIAFNKGENAAGNPLPGVIGHEDGFDLNGNPGGSFFTMIGPDGKTINKLLPGDYQNITAFNFAVADDLVADPSKLAASDTNDRNQPSNNKVILGLITLKDNKTLFAEGGAYQFVNSLSSTVAIDKSQADSYSKYYGDITKTIENQRLQVSGVSLNEEVANVVKYQHLYQTASKLINVINDIYNTTINGMMR